MSDLNRLCFLLVEREKANTLRRKYLARYYRAKDRLDKIRRKKNLRQHLKYAETKLLLAKMQSHHTNYRRVADLMNAQRSEFFRLRKSSGATPRYNSSNACTHIRLGEEIIGRKHMQEKHNAYVFEMTILLDKSLENPYAKEVYGETKEDRKEDVSAAN